MAGENREIRGRIPFAGLTKCDLGSEIGYEIRTKGVLSL